jgi:serpin B
MHIIRYSQEGCMARVAKQTIHKLAHANNAFGFRLLDELARRDPDTNTFISGYSVATALAMTLNGARGETQRAIADTLMLKDMGYSDEQALNQASAALAKQLTALDPRVQLQIANALWLREAPAADFKQRLERYYAAEAAQLDFDSADAPRVINEWVKQKTAGKIDRIVDDTRGVVALLANALYFKGAWAKPFDPGRTSERPFSLIDGGKRPLPMMTQAGKYPYVANDDFQAIALPYGEGRAQMFIFLPNPESTLDRFRQQLNLDRWKRWTESFEDREGNVTLPRFTVEYSGQLNDALSSLGMDIAFSSQADFSRVGIGPLLISEVIHKTHLDVNEEGTEAAAVTAVSMIRSFMPLERFSMVIDRPFFCAICDSETSAVLFMGFIVDPQPL